MHWPKFDPRHGEALLTELLAAVPSAPPLSAPPQRVVLYGAGMLGLLAAEFLDHCGVEVTCALDRAARPGQVLNGSIPVVSPADVTPAGRDVLLITTVNSPNAPIAADLRQAGWRTVLPFYDAAQVFAARHPLGNGWFSGSLSQADQAQMRHVYGAFADDHSRAAYLQFVAWRVCRRELAFDTALPTLGDRYFIPEVRAALRGGETVIDGGAYDGRFLSAFVAACPGRPRVAHLLEPDPANLAALRHTLANDPALQALDIRVHPVGAAERMGTLSFHQGFGMASRAAGPEGAEHVRTVHVPAVAIDDLGIPANFLKLHLEGGELPALRGAAATIAAHRPIITATVYHNRDGLWRTAAELLAMLEGYRLLFRTHSWCGTGAVVYALPDRGAS